jgi:hypothetical protein
MKKSSLKTLIGATRELANTVQCDDGIANAVLHEVAERLEMTKAVCEYFLNRPFGSAYKVGIRQILTGDFT